jgi:hypothetical protein
VLPRVESFKILVGKMGIKEMFAKNQHNKICEIKTTPGSIVTEKYITFQRS